MIEYVAARKPFAPVGPVAEVPIANPTVIMLVIAAALRPLLYVLGMFGVYSPYSRWAVDGFSLLGVVLVLVWLHAAFTAMRGRTSFSPGMAVGGWFIPLANIVLPALILRDAWRTAVGRGGGIAFVWMIAWWITTITTVLASLGLFFAGDVDTSVILADEVLFTVPMDVQMVGRLYSFVSMGSTALAYGLLAAIVNRVNTAR